MNRSILPGLLAFCIVLFYACREIKSGEVVDLPEKIDFNFHVKPILSDRCFACHGPDGNQRKGDLRLDKEDGLLRQRLQSGSHAFYAGNVSRSEAYQRITSSDPDFRMPPPDSDLSLSEREILIIKRWIEQGAPYAEHWAFIPPRRDDPPANKDPWIRNPIDQFVFEELQQNEISPNPTASNEVLLRRLHLDLTGLPPTLLQLDEFLAKPSDDAYSNQITQLLSSANYGENMALGWLDVARYADSHGFSQDGYREMYPWRDWVIEALNKNLPFDKFIEWQLAGDLIPDATNDQKLATAFLRNSRSNSEGGIVKEEYRVEVAADRAQTTATAFMGLTMECARCHDHKFDPISQKEYYQFFSFFNQANEEGLVQKDGNNGAELLLTNKEIEQRLRVIDSQIQHFEEMGMVTDGSLIPKLSEDKATFFFDFQRASIKGEENDYLIHGSDLISGQTLPCYGQPELITDPDRIGLKVTAYDYVNLGPLLPLDRSSPFSFSFGLRPHHLSDYLQILSRSAGKNKSEKGFDVSLIEGHLTLRLIHSLPSDLLEVRIKQPLIKDKWEQIGITYDGSGKAEGVRFFLDGMEAETEVLFDQLQRSFENPPGRAQRVLLGGKQDYAEVVDDGFCIVDKLMVFDYDLSTQELDKQENNYSDSLRKYREEKFAMQDSLVSVMVMEDLDKHRKTFVLERGQYDAPGMEVRPGTPVAVMPFPDTLSANRLGLAKWLVHKDNPLTARVLVNRFWQHFFGRGFVETSEDFGNQGHLPHHPELLDWLANYFVDSGWDLKKLVRLIVESSTYRQSSQLSAEMREKDPDNLLLARGPHQRLPAEIIRDNALAASGLLHDEIGGRSVKPYQPAGLWSEKNQFSEVLTEYEQDHGEELYRRSLYTFWRRTSHHPVMAAFDAPTRDYCTVRRQQTTTPLQALVLLNETQFVEISKALAQRVMQSQSKIRDQITEAYRLSTSIRPSEEVVDLLEELWQEEVSRFRAEPKEAEALLNVGEYKVEEENKSALAALTVVTNLILNFDETITKR